MIRLLETGPGGLTLLLPPGRDAVAWHAALTDEIGRHLSPAHAGVLARPVPRPEGGFAWMGEGGSRTRYAELPAEARQALDAALGAILSDVRRLAESGVAPAVSAAWPGLRECPDMGHVFAVDGRPVLAAWGHAGPSGAGGVGARLARLDDGVRWHAAPRVPWSVYGATLAALALFGLAAGLLLPLARQWFVPPLAACTVVPGQLQAMRDQAAVEARGAELRTLLASVTEEIGRKRLLCPIAVLPAPVVPVPPSVPAPVPPPMPHADLPQEKWDRKDLGMLQGCWHLDTALRISEGENRSVAVRSWQLCFNGSGSGNQIETTEDGRSCTGPLTAAFSNDGLLTVNEPRDCAGSIPVGRWSLSCRRTSDTEAVCEGRNLSPGPGRETFGARFRR